MTTTQQGRKAPPPPLHWDISEAQRNVQRRLTSHYYLDCPTQVQEYLIDLEFASLLNDDAFTRLHYFIRERDWHAFIHFTSEPFYWKETLGVTDERFAMHQRMLDNLIANEQLRRQAGGTPYVEVEGLGSGWE